MDAKIASCCANQNAVACATQNADTDSQSRTATSWRIRFEKGKDNENSLVLDICTPVGSPPTITTRVSTCAGKVSFKEIGAEGLVQVYVYNVEVHPDHRRSGVATALLKGLSKKFPQGHFSLRFRPEPNTTESCMRVWKTYRRWALSEQMRVVEIKSATAGGHVIDLTKNHVPAFDSTLWFSPERREFRFHLGNGLMTSLFIVEDPCSSSSASLGTGWRLWECGILLARFIEPTQSCGSKQTEDLDYFPISFFKGKQAAEGKGGEAEADGPRQPVRTLELGAGVGLLSAALACLGAEALATDSPAVSATVGMANAAANAKAIKDAKNGGRLSVLPLDWRWLSDSASPNTKTASTGSTTTDATAATQKFARTDFEKKFAEPLKHAIKFDFVFGSDLVFHRDAIRPLILVIRKTLSKSGEFLMAHKNRKQELKEHMISAFKNAGFDVAEMETRRAALTIFRMTWRRASPS
jgi:predicted nicotinamide N-methyase